MALASSVSMRSGRPGHFLSTRLHEVWTTRECRDGVGQWSTPGLLCR